MGFFFPQNKIIIQEKTGLFPLRIVIIIQGKIGFFLLWNTIIIQGKLEFLPSGIQFLSNIHLELNPPKSRFLSQHPPCLPLWKIPIFTPKFFVSMRKIPKKSRTTFPQTPMENSLFVLPNWKKFPFFWFKIGCVQEENPKKFDIPRRKPAENSEKKKKRKKIQKKSGKKTL